MAQKLSAGFMAELFKLVYMDLNITRMVVNNLTYQLIPKEWPGFKFLLKEATEVLKEKDKIPSLGVVSQKYADSDFVIEAIDAVQSAAKVDKEIIIDQLEAYIKDVEFQLLSKKVHDLYEEGKKEDAIRVNAEESQRILSLSLRHEAGGFQKVFADFDKRMRGRREEEDGEIPSRVMFGLDKIDDISEGGATIEDTVLWIMRSGVGKSTALRYHGMQAAFDGHPVLHIQLEGGARACLERYDQFWTGQKYGNIRKGVIDDKLAEKLDKAFENIKSYSKDIDVYSFEKFGQATMVDVRNVIVSYYKKNGYYPHVLILDSLDLVATGTNRVVDNNPTFKKEKLQTCAQLLKNLCVEFKMVGFTAAQAGNVPLEIWDNSDKVIDRSYTEGDRTLVKPFSFVFTGNRTREEKKQNIMRIYMDKVRDYDTVKDTFPIVTDYGRGRFCDKALTAEYYGGDKGFTSSTSEKKTRKKKDEGGEKQNDVKTEVI